MKIKKINEKGYTLIELLIAVSIMFLASGASGAAIFQIFKNIGGNNDHITAARQVQNAGYRISLDTQMAESAVTNNLTAPDFLILNWTEWDSDMEPSYHSVTYSFDGLTNNTGNLMRSHWSSAGASEETLVAINIYYYPGDNATSIISYQDRLLKLRLTAVSDNIQETREYNIIHRPTF